MLKRILIGGGISVGILAIAIGILIGMVVSTHNPKGDNLEVLSHESGNKALVIYQPGISDYSSEIAHEIARGLNNGGFEVFLNHPGDNLSDDISEYSIVVFGSATYAGQPSEALTNYISRIEDFLSSKVILYSTGLNPQKPELDLVEEFINKGKAYKKVKFNVGDKENEIKRAYNLGRKLAGE